MEICKHAFLCLLRWSSSLMYEKESCSGRYSSRRSQVTNRSPSFLSCLESLHVAVWSVLGQNRIEKIKTEGAVATDNVAHVILCCVIRTPISRSSFVAILQTANSFSVCQNLHITAGFTLKENDTYSISAYMCFAQSAVYSQHTQIFEKREEDQCMLILWSGAIVRIKTILQTYFLTDRHHNGSNPMHVVHTQRTLSEAARLHKSISGKGRRF